MGTRRTLKELESLLIGNTFERLTIESHGEIIRNKRQWKCNCVCGKTIYTDARKILTARVKSCGCINMERVTTHGMSDSREYNSYRCMRKRCYDENNKDFYNYGARGITVCDSWLVGFENFFKDMGLRPLGKTLDRIDGNKGYSPENCRWADNVTQSRNRRKRKPKSQPL